MNNLISDVICSNLAFVTPSYPPDFVRCKLLVESLDRCCPQIRHYIIVDRHDIKIFSALASERTILIESESIVDSTMRRIPFGGGFWIGPRILARGWIMQQIRKVGCANLFPEETLVFCDSDMAFIRPFDESAVRMNGLIGLLDVAFENSQTRDWTRLARTLLGLRQGNSVRGHVGQMICWRRDVMLKMQERIEFIQGSPWQLALARMNNFSEYILYGVFVREHLGYDVAQQAPSDVPLVRTSWDTDITTVDGLKGLFDGINDAHIAVMAHSKDSFDWGAYCELVRAQWRRSGVA